MSETIKPKITHVIFDMDGLILDTETRYSMIYEKLMARFGKKFTYETKLKIMGRTSNESCKMMVDEFNLPLTPEEFQQALVEACMEGFNEPIEVLPGAERLIRHLHQEKIPIGVATSSATTTFEMKTKFHKELFSLFDFLLVAGGDPEVQRGKPDPQTFLVAASRFSNPPASPEHCIVFEDSPNGVQAANAAGMISIWVPDPRMPKDMVKPYLRLNSLCEFRPEDFGLPPFKTTEL